MKFDLRGHSHLITIAGSRAYGMDGPESDVDLKGVAIPPREYFHGCLRRFEQAASPTDLAVFVQDLTVDEQAIASSVKLEGTVYHIVKFVKFAAEANPNILEVLFCRDAEVRLSTTIGERLRECRDLFVSARARTSFGGYAAGQLKRLKAFRRWIEVPPVAPPTRAEFGLPDRPVAPPDRLTVANAAVDREIASWRAELPGLDDAAADELRRRLSALLVRAMPTSEVAESRTSAGTIGPGPDLDAAIRREKAYQDASREWSRYLQWRSRPESARGAAEARHGYDTKHAAHLVRLLKMGCEVMSTDRVEVWRGGIDAEELREIRAGAWSFERLLEHVESLQAALDAAGAAEALPIPEAPDRIAIDGLRIELVESALYRN